MAAPKKLLLEVRFAVKAVFELDAVTVVATSYEYGSEQPLGEFFAECDIAWHLGINLEQEEFLEFYRMEGLNKIIYSESYNMDKLLEYGELKDFIFIGSPETEKDYGRSSSEESTTKEEGEEDVYPSEIQ